MATARADIVYIGAPRIGSRYARWVNAITSRNRINWPLRHVLTYPLYEAFDIEVYRRFSDAVRNGRFDVVHAFTPVIPRYPVRISGACQRVPFILGPVNGGFQFPRGFGDIAKKEFAYINFLRHLCKLHPWYARTYRRADRILVGSSFTMGLLRGSLGIDAQRFIWFPENGVGRPFFGHPRGGKRNEKMNLLFVGRLVPYKCADVVIHALRLLKNRISDTVHLTIVGDGPEKKPLQRLVRRQGLAAAVIFVGQVSNAETIKYYRWADIFCFPSIREFGGAVVLEAMASGLPCIIADYGGMAEYLTTNAGFKIPLVSKGKMARAMAGKIEELVKDETLRRKLSAGAVDRARMFSWERKTRQLIQVYADALTRSSRGANP